MFSRKALGLINTGLSVSDVVVHLPVRRVVAMNIAEQVREGYSYEFPDRAWESLDQLLNFSLEREFRAPTPSQVKLASVITAKLDLTPDDGVFVKKLDTELYIDKHYSAFQRFKDVEALSAFDDSTLCET